MAFKIAIGIFLVLAVSAGFYSYYINSYGAGTKEIYISPILCPKEARYVINEFNISLIHSCDIEKRMVDGQPTTFVIIKHGHAEDCIAGCHYKRIEALVEAEKITLLSPSSS